MTWKYTNGNELHMLQNFTCILISKFCIAFKEHYIIFNWYKVIKMINVDYFHKKKFCKKFVIGSFSSVQFRIIHEIFENFSDSKRVHDDVNEIQKKEGILEVLKFFGVSWWHGSTHMYWTINKFIDSVISVNCVIRCIIRIIWKIFFFSIITHSLCI